MFGIRTINRPFITHFVDIKRRIVSVYNASLFYINSVRFHYTIIFRIKFTCIINTFYGFNAKAISTINISPFVVLNRC